jgi:hypothetical protein
MLQEPTTGYSVEPDEFNPNSRTGTEAKQTKGIITKMNEGTDFVEYLDIHWHRHRQ